MNETLILMAATPLVLLVPLIEGLVGLWYGRRLYRFAATVNDLLQSLGHIVVSSMTRVGGLFAYGWVYDHAAILDLSSHRAATWVLGFVAIDGLFYLRHRSLHRVAILWAGHAVHHEAHQFNYAVAQRTGWLQDFANWPFVAIAAVVGVPLEVALASVAINHIYQLFLHTELVPRMPSIEWLLATPSTHRVHHASNPQYVDKNFGGVLGVWDRLFGTWEPEVEPPTFGTIAAMKSWDPLENNFEPFARLFHKARATGTIVGALRVVFGPPSWEEGVGELPPAPPEPRIDPASPQDRATRLLAGGGLAVAIVLTVALLVAAPSLEVVPRVTAGLAVLGVLYGVGRLLTVSEEGAEPA